MKKSLFLIVLLSLTSFILVFEILQNYLVFKALKELDFAKATKISKTAIFLPKTINFITFKQIELINFWEFLIQEISTIQELMQNTQTYLTQIINNELANQELANQIIEDLEKINDKLNKIDIKELNELKLITNDSLIIAKKLLQTNQNYIVVLQNNDELRATGGFLGSFLIFKTQNGQVAPLEIQDIYVPDGQFNGFLEAPPGLNEYLSSGKGLRLPDANWWPNFADSAEQILYFFETVTKEKYQGVIALNLNIVEQLLELTGEIYLPDYKTYINKDNFAQIARADRNEFFPGSQEKANFLNHFFNIFKLQLIHVVQENPKAIFALGKKFVTEKNLQIYSRDTEINDVLQKRKMTGEMYNKQKLYFLLVESNVGINKANRLVNREVLIKIGEDQEKIIINFQNNNKVPYVNYQRLYVDPATKLMSVFIDAKQINPIDQKTLLTKEGNQFKEIGFLVVVPAEGQSQIEINLESPFSLESKKNIFIQKQAGLAKIPYIVNYQEQSQSFELTSDQNLIFD